MCDVVSKVEFQEVILREVIFRTVEISVCFKTLHRYLVSTGYIAYET